MSNQPSIPFNRISAFRHMRVGAPAPVASDPSAPSILLQTLVTRGERVDEGVIIEAENLTRLAIARELEKDPNFLLKISPEQFEEFIAGSYKQAKFDDVILTPRS